MKLHETCKISNLVFIGLWDKLLSIAQCWVRGSSQITVLVYSTEKLLWISPERRSNCENVPTLQDRANERQNGSRPRKGDSGDFTLINRHQVALVSSDFHATYHKIVDIYRVNAIRSPLWGNPHTLQHMAGSAASDRRLMDSGFFWRVKTAIFTMRWFSNSSATKALMYHGNIH